MTDSAGSLNNPIDSSGSSNIDEELEGTQFKFTMTKMNAFIANKKVINMKTAGLPCVHFSTVKSVLGQNRKHVITTMFHQDGWKS